MISSAPVLGDQNALKCELAGEVLRSSGILRLRVTGWSMLPSILPGDTLIIDRVPGDAVFPGDIVLFGRDRRFFVHRVELHRFRTSSNDPQVLGFITRGDAMPAPDAPVSDAELMGRVSFIVRNGKRFQPSRSLSFPARAVAAVVRRSILAARVVVGIHEMRRASSHQTSAQSQVHT
jgi:signal peptidase I